MRKSPSRLTPALVVLSALCLRACFLLPKEEEILEPPLVESTAVTYSVHTATRDTIETRVAVTGYFQYTKQQPLYFTYRGGRLDRILVTYGDVVKKGQVLAELDTGNLELEIEQQSIRLKKVKLQYQRYLTLGSDKFQRDMALLDIQLEEIKLRSLNEELRRAQLTSPMVGVVVYIGKYFPGDFVNAYTTLIQVADPSELMVAYKGFEASEFPLGTRVRIDLRGNRFDGEVIYTPLHMPPDASEALRDTIFVGLDETPADVSSGEAATIIRVLARKEDVIVLPRHLVRKYMDHSFVYILEDGIKKERNVEIGLQTHTEVEIVKGIEAGDQVIER